MTDFRISSDDRIEFSRSGILYQIASVLCQRFITVLRIGAGDALISSLPWKAPEEICPL